MKRIILTISILVSCLCLTAQEHLSFKGIPISGSIKTFCNKLGDSGFTKVSDNNNLSLFHGNFTGRKAYVGVAATEDGNVFGVSVLFESSEEWNTLVNTYNYYKDLYTRKYGKPSYCEENNPSYSDGNHSKMLTLYDGRVTWGSVWEAKGGEIEISVTKDIEKFMEGMVIIVYRDASNIAAKQKNDLDDI